MSHEKLKKALARARQENPERLPGKDSTNRNVPEIMPPDSNAAKDITQTIATDVKPPQTNPGENSSGDTPNRGITQTKTEEISYQSLEKFKVIYDCKLNPVADQVKILRTQMLQRLLPGGGNSVLITSPRPREGKTTNAISLAISLAQEIERTVLLIDANLRNPSITDYFGLTRGKGLADYLLGKATIPEILINPGIPKLTLLPGGRPLSTSSEVLGASRMEELVQEMKARYPERILVFDGPDILSAADSLLFSNFVDGIVMVVEAEATTRDDIKLAIERIGKENLIGTILNKVRE